MSTQDDPYRSNIGGRDPCNPCGVDAYAAIHVRTYACLTITLLVIWEPTCKSLDIQGGSGKSKLLILSEYVDKTEKIGRK